MPANQNVRDKTAYNAVVALGGKDLARLLSLEVGNRSLYEDYDENDLGSFVAYGPTLLRMTLPITNNNILRKIGGSEEEMLKDYQMAIRFMAAVRRKPLTVTNLQNVRFTSIVQIYPRGGQPYEEVTGTVEKVTHDN